MIVYQASKTQFRSDVKSNSIEVKVHASFEKVLGQKTAKSEIRSWQNSLMYMSNVLDDSSIPDDAGICIEYMLPRSTKRIDFVITGQNSNKENSVVIIELKQWQDIQTTDLPDIVKTFVGGAVREQNHPSYQALAYSQYLEDLSEVISHEKIGLYPCAYLHNCEDGRNIRHSNYEHLLMT